MSKQSSYATGAYWKARSDLIYYQYFTAIMRCVAKDATSLIDVGSGNAAYLEWIDWIPRKASVDIRVPYNSMTVEGIKGDIHQLQIERHDVCTCLQVLEHVPDARKFAQRLLDLASLIVVSVPYKWPEESTKGHIHDPVDEGKIESWFGRKPNYRLVVQEPFQTKKGKRMFAIFDPADPDRKFGSEYWRNRRTIAS